MMFVVYIIMGLYLFWCLYVLVMGLYRAHLAGRLRGLNRVLAWPVVIAGALIDVVANLTVASLVFWERPREWLVTHRLARHVNTGTGWRHRLARWICDSLLDPFDPTIDGHC